MKKKLSAVIVMFLVLAGCSPEKQDQTKLRFSLAFTEDQSQDALDGRMLLMVSTDDSREPRFQMSSRDPNTQLIFGVDVEGLEPGQEAVVDASAIGYPRDSISEIPPGEYWVQGLLNRYETFHRSDGHVVKLPPDKGEGQKWNTKPDNLYSKPQRVKIDPAKDETIRIVLDQKIPHFPEPEDTKYIKHLEIESERLTEFWGRPVELGAIILLPEGFDEHPEARYPVLVYQGHFHRTLYLPVGFRETPPPRGPSSADRSDREGYQQLYEEYSYKLYQDWTSPDFPRFIVVTMQHANPFFDDSYAVNSENLGPYGDALTHELIPYIEENYRGIGEGWARGLIGGSTGGWEALGVQIFYPDEYNGAWASCPDFVDFRAWRTVNIYEHKNAHYVDSQWKRTPRPVRRNYLGEILETYAEKDRFELVLGTRARSGGQEDIWQAVYGPVGEDGYPKPVWDKATGEIDPAVAEYMRENYDLRHILERDWRTLGPKLEGKLRIYTGDMDSGYLNNSVYLMEEFLESTTDPYYGGEVVYGDRREHCWSGDMTTPNSVGRLTYIQRFGRKFIDHILKTAPPGADITSWRY
jgi:hypothetical protein